MSDLGNKQIFARNLNYYIDLRKKTKPEVAKAIDIPYTTFLDWCNGNSYPRIDKIEKLANYFGIMKSALVENKYRKTINVYSSVHAGIPNEMIDNVIDTEELAEQMIKSDKEYFGLKVKGDSMYPEFIEGDTVIVEKCNNCESGSYCIAAINGNEAFLKKIIKNESTVILQALNPKYEPIILTNKEIKSKHVVILGKVVEIRRKL